MILLLQKNQPETSPPTSVAGVCCAGGNQPTNSKTCTARLWPLRVPRRPWPQSDSATNLATLGFSATWGGEIFVVATEKGHENGTKIALHHSSLENDWNNWKLKQFHSSPGVPTINQLGW